jgi:hypothetical protein
VWTRGLGGALALLMMFAGEPSWSQTASDQPSTPPVVVTPPPAFIPGPGINRPDWQELGPDDHLGAPPLAPGGLPHYVGLPRPAREAAERLRDLMALLEGHLQAGRLASARIALTRAEEHVHASEEEHLVLKLHPEWSGPRESLLDLRARYESVRRGPVDAESQRLAEIAGIRILKDVKRLSRGFETLDLKTANERLAVMHRILNDSESDPWLIDNPAWRRVRQPLQNWLQKHEKALALRVGAVRLTEAIARIDALRISADAAIVQGSVSTALGDLEALDEACLAFEHELDEMLKNGYELAQLAWSGPTGELRGREVRERVKSWREESQRRYKRLSGAPE